MVLCRLLSRLTRNLFTHVGPGGNHPMRVGVLIGYK
jgi:hypothetical protein